MDELDIIKYRVLVLFNPYHDRIGRFATKVGSSYAKAREAETKIAKGAVERVKGVKKGDVGAVAGGTAGAVAGGAIGYDVGRVIGATIGSVAATVAVIKFGVSMETGQRIADGMAALGSITGTAAGATKGARVGKKAGRGVADWFEFAETKSAGLDTLLAVLRDFMKSDKQRFAVEADQNPMFADWGFKRDGKYLYADKDHIGKLVKFIEGLK